MRKCVQRAVHALLFTCISLKVKAQTCDLDLALGQEWTDESGVKTIATQLNFTGDGIPPPWSFELEGDFEAGVIPWDWSVTSRSSEKVAGIVPGYWQYVNQTPVALGALISFTGDASNLNVSLNGQECAVNVSEIQLGTPTASVEGSTSPQPMKTLNGQLLGVNGEPVKLVGVNWFGWTNDQTSFFDGLWQGPSSLTLDYATVVYRLQLLGVNAVRIVFSFDNIFNGTPTSLATSSCPVAQQSDIQKSVTDPSMSVNDGTIPPPTVQPSQPTGTCNAYIPSDTVLDAFVTAIRILTSNGMYIILDNQSQSDNTVIENTPQWVKYWSTLMETLWQQPETAAYVIVDAFNEPDFFNLKFEPVGGLPGARALYIQVWDAIYAVAPNTVFGFEGLGQGAYVQNWVSFSLSSCKNVKILHERPCFQQIRRRDRIRASRLSFEKLLRGECRVMAW